MKSITNYIINENLEFLDILDEMLNESEEVIEESAMGEKKKELSSKFKEDLLTKFYEAANIDPAKVDKILEKSGISCSERAKFGLKMMLCGAAVAVNDKGVQDLKGMPILCEKLIALAKNSKKSLWTVMMKKEPKKEENSLI